MKWVKRDDGWVCGIFEGLGHKTGMNPNLFRFVWLLSLLLFGSGLLFYIILIFVIPHEYEVINYERPKFLGVCYELSHRLDVELSLVRLFTVGSFFLTGGITFVVYALLWLVLPSHYTRYP
jgi:phage shock protein PspC (stress-responsive transcriptional regulator)